MSSSFTPDPRRMSGVQGGLGEHKRDILKLREARNGATLGVAAFPSLKPDETPHDPQEVNGLTVKSASHEVDIQKSFP